MISGTRTWPPRSAPARTSALWGPSSATQIQTTVRYAHVAMDPLRKATNQVSGVIAALAAVEA